MTDVAEARKTLESFVFRLGYEMIAADKGTKEKPFESVSELTPEKIFALEPTATAAAVVDLIALIKKVKPSPPLRSIMRVCEKQAKLLARTAQKAAK